MKLVLGLNTLMPFIRKDKENIQDKYYLIYLVMQWV